jgi:hypothetical protein
MTATEATAVASTKTCVSTETTTAVSAPGVASAMLRPEGYSQEKRERRDGPQATHYLKYTPDHKGGFVKFCTEGLPRFWVQF